MKLAIIGGGLFGCNIANELSNAVILVLFSLYLTDWFALTVPPVFAATVNVKRL